VHGHSKIGKIVGGKYILKTLCEVDDDHIVMIDTKYNHKSVKV